MKERKGFKKLFQSDKLVKIDEVFREFGFSSNGELASALREWKLEEYFNITGTFVCRNEKPTRWDSIKKDLKKAGKWALTKCVPVAIGMATGGAGLGVIAAPAVSDIVTKLKNRGLNVSEESQAELENVLINKTDASIDKLMKKLRVGNKGRGIAPDKLERLIRLSIKEDLHPFLAEIQAVLGTLKQEQEHLTSIFEDWTVEQRGKLEGLQEGVLDQFGLTIDSLDRIESAMLPSLEAFQVRLASIEQGVVSISSDIQEANNRLYLMEDKLDALYNEVCREALDDLTLDLLFQTSRIQFQNVRLAGKFDKPYDENLFIETPRLTQEFMSFLRQKHNTTPVFLLLASVGMGKTWNAVYSGIQSRDSLLAIPFFVPIHMGYGEILKDTFQISESSMAGLARIIGEKCERIHSNTGKRILFIFDGIDEYPSANREPFLNFLRHLLQGYKHAVRILLTDRTTDWCENKQLRGFYRDISHLIWSNSELKGVCNLYKIATSLSGFLDGFMDSQLNRAIIQYGLDSQQFPPKLYDLCHKPYVLRIIFEREVYFDPENVNEFWSVFYDQLNPVNTILDRMGISNPNELLFPLFEAFGRASAVQSERDLKSLIERNRAEWEVILRSGLIQTEQERFQVVYKFDSVFHPVINDYLTQVGKLTQARSATSVQEHSSRPTKIEPSTLEIKERTTQVSKNIGDVEKRFYYFETLWNEALERQNYEEALEMQQEALKLAKEAYNVELTKKAKTLEVKLELHKKISKELQPRLDQEMQKDNWESSINTLKEIEKISHSNDFEHFIKFKDSKTQEIRSVGIDLLDQAQQQFDAGQWDEAIRLFEHSKEIATQFNDSKGISSAEEMISSTIDAKRREEKERLEQERMKSALRKIIQERVHAPLSTLSNDIDVPSNVAELLLKHIAYWDEDTNEFWANKEMLDEFQKNHRIISFRGAQIPQFEADVLQALETQSGKDFSMINTVEWNTTMGFTVQNNRVTVIGLYHCGLATISESIGNLSSLKELWLNNNQLSILPESIGNLSSLKELWLYDNELLTLPESIGNLSSLESLRLDNNRLTTLPEAIGNLKSLEYLDLESNQLSFLPELIGNLSSLRNLYLAGNQLTTLPKTIENLKMLTSLDIKSNQLLALPESIRNLKSLETLNLESNQLSILPESIGNLKSLQTLSIFDNNLSALPKSIGDLTSLTYLIVGDNNISTLPVSIGQLSSLQTLLVEKNELSTLPKSIGDLKSLEKLSLGANQLLTFLESIGNLTSLTYLNLESNRFSTLPESIGNLSSLKELNLNNNKLSTLPESIGNLSSLKELNLNNNKLSTLPESIGNLSLLEELDLQFNQLSTLPESISNLKSLKNLNILDNNISTLLEAINEMNSLEYLIVSSNPLNSRAKSILKKLKKRGVNVVST